MRKLLERLFGPWPQLPLRPVDKTRDVLVVEWVARCLAEARRSAKVTVADLLGALYVATLEKISKYWTDWENFEQFVVDECGLLQPRWFYWVEVYHVGRQRTLVKRFKEWSPELVRIFATAQELAESWGKKTGSNVPILKPEHILLATATQVDLEISRKLVESGLDLKRLEDAVKK